VVALDHHQPIATLLQAVQQIIGSLQIRGVIRFGNAIRRRVATELPAIEQIAQADDQVGLEVFGSTTEYIQCRLISRWDMNIMLSST